MYLSCEQLRKVACVYLATLLGIKSSKDGGSRNAAKTNDVQLKELPPHPAVLNEENDDRPKESSSSSGLAASASDTETTGRVESGMERLLVNIRDLLQSSVAIMTRLRHEKDENERMMNDWMVAAAVIDRITFILVTIFFVIGTVALIVLCVIPYYT